MTEAVRNSINIPSSMVIERDWCEAGIEFAESLGIEMDKEDRNLAIALGGLTHGAYTT